MTREEKLEYTRRYYAANKEKWLAWREKNKDRERTRRYRRRGLPEPTRLIPDRCELCGGPPNGHGSLHLDHCHETNRFRGWLCSNCNHGLGKLGDNIEGLQRAIEYLKRSMN